MPSSVSSVEMQTDFDVVLYEVPAASRVSVVKALRRIRPDLTMDQAFAMTRDAVAHTVMEERPLTVAPGVSKFEAEEMVKDLRAAGAEARMV